MIDVKFKIAPGADMPQPATEGSAACDLRAFIPECQTAIIAPCASFLIKTGLFMEMPQGVAAMVLPRSGLAMKHGITVANAPGLIDSDYRGELGVILINHGHEPFPVQNGDRIAQLMFVRHAAAAFIRADELSVTDRGARGFGSTGKA